ncbi:MAG TPA: DUF6314 family protein [Thermohalobaculum sp.]|nr:DUF6314 family protein [Thermohalobaculum sp.]
MRIATEAWFRGRWRMARLVAGPGGEVTAAFAGTCRFAPDGEGLVCEESGILRHRSGRYRAGRVTLWRFAGAGRVEVRFADGRPFHAFSAERPETEHRCGADRYRVAYAFDADRWLSRWLVCGPAKDFVMTTRYRRA